MFKFCKNQIWPCCCWSWILVCCFSHLFSRVSFSKLHQVNWGNNSKELLNNWTDKLWNHCVPSWEDFLPRAHFFLFLNLPIEIFFIVFKLKNNKKFQWKNATAIMYAAIESTLQDTKCQNACDDCVKASRHSWGRSLWQAQRLSVLEAILFCWCSVSLFPIIILLFYVYQLYFMVWIFNHDFSIGKVLMQWFFSKVC